MKHCNCNQQIYAVPDKTRSSFDVQQLTGRKIPFSDEPELITSWVYHLADVHGECFCCRDQGNKGWTKRSRSKKPKFMKSLYN